eukprot:493482-Prymnesium_polylepis.1
MSGCPVEYCIPKPQVTQEGERSSPRALVWNARDSYCTTREAGTRQARHTAVSPDSALSLRPQATGHRHSACDVCALVSFAFESVVYCGLRCALVYCTVPYSAYFIVRLYALEPWRLAASGCVWLRRACVWQASGRRLAGVPAGRLDVWASGARLGTS